MTEQIEPLQVPEPAAPAEPLDPDTLDGRVEAVLMSVERAMSAAKLAEAVGAGGARAVQEAIERLNDFYEQSGRSFRIEQVAGGFQILTLPEHRDVVAAVHRTKSDNKLSPAALETLAIIAYKQPIMRAQIETIRGVASGEVIRALMDRHLVKIVGRAEEVGRPMLYGTTKTFLELFGLASLKDLPSAQELAKP
jgi:segregation and condensation protein B